MTSEEFAAWLAERGLSHEQAAPLFATKHRSEVYLWATGRRTVPPRVALIAELREENEELRALLAALE